MKRSRLAYFFVIGTISLSVSRAESIQLPLNEALVSILEEKCGEQAEGKFDSLETLIEYANTNVNKQDSIQLAIDAFSELSSGEMSSQKKRVLFSLKNWLLAFNLDSNGKLSTSQEAQRTRCLLLLFLAADKHINAFTRHHALSTLGKSKEHFNQWLPRFLDKVITEIPNHLVVNMMDVRYNNNLCFGWYTLYNKVNGQEKPELYEKDASKRLCFAQQFLSEYYRKHDQSKHATAFMYAMLAILFGGDELAKRNLAYFENLFKLNHDGFLPAKKYKKNKLLACELETLIEKLYDEGDLSNPWKKTASNLLRLYNFSKLIIKKVSQSNDSNEPSLTPTTLGELITLAGQLDVELSTGEVTYAHKFTQTPNVFSNSKPLTNNHVVSTSNGNCNGVKVHSSQKNHFRSNKSLTIFENCSSHAETPEEFEDWELISAQSTDTTSPTQNEEMASITKGKEFKVLENYWQ